MRGFVLIIVVFSCFSGNALATLTCQQALNNLQQLVADSINTLGKSCQTFPSRFSPNATYASPSWSPVTGADALIKGCETFAIPSIWQSACHETFQFTYTTVHSAINQGKLWCSGTGVFVINLANKTANTCVLQGLETDIMVIDMESGLYDYVSTVYDNNGFGASFEKCGTQMCQ